MPFSRDPSSIHCQDVLRAVYLVPEPPWPPTSGGRLHAANLARALTNWFDLRVIYPAEEGPFPSSWATASRKMEEARSSAMARTRHALRAIARGTHIALERAVGSGLLEAYKTTLEDIRPAAVVLARPFFGPFIDVARAIGASVVIDADEDLGPVARGVVLHGPSSWARARALLEIMTVSRLQRHEYAKADQVWVTATNEAIRFSYLGDRVRVLPNVVDSGATPPQAGNVSAVGFVGWYRYPPNEEAALELITSVMPHVHRMGGPRRLLLIGRDPTPAMLRAARGREWIEITGEVADTVPLIRSAGLLAAPIRSGGGTRVKILEALAQGVPVVSTTLGVSGLELKPGRDAIVADTPSDLARGICQVASDAELRQQLITHGHDVVRQRYSNEALWAAMGSALRSLFPSLVR
jgi:glycosyltransferase involved in cell wall biosynthesis